MERLTGIKTTGSPFSAQPIFASIGELAQYGLSSRGVAIDVAVADRPEEFPDFTGILYRAGALETRSRSTH